MTLEHAEIDVSVVTFNSARWIAAFLDSLVAQDYPAARINLLVRDNGSSAGEYERCRQEIERRTAAFLSVHLDRGDNLGFGAGHNCNFARGRADLFLVCNVDLEFERGSIAAAVAALNADDARVACREFRQQPYEHPKHYHPATLETAWCSSACVLFRRSAFAAVGGYEERIFLYGEDVELSYRLRAHGYRLKYCPDAVCTHHSYERPGQIKPEQFFGSREANLYLRLRYGTALQIVVGAVLQLSSWFSWPRFPRYYRRLAVSAVRVVRNTPHFLRTHRRGDVRFGFRLWGYGARRAGAFHARPPLPNPVPLVSIIVRTHAGRGGWLREALLSVVNQTYRNIELVVVEDGSETARAEVERVASIGRLNDVVYRSIAKGGRCRAGNAGLEAARGELIGFLDDDDLLYADHVEALVAELAAHPAAGAAYGLAFEVPTRVESREPLRYHAQAPIGRFDPAFSRGALVRGNFIPVQAVLFRRGCYERHGGFDLALENLEDWELWARYARDTDFRRVAKTTSLYRIPADADELLRRSAVLESYRPHVVARLGAFGSADVGGPLISARRMQQLTGAIPFLRSFVLPARRLGARWRARGSNTTSR